MEINRVKKVADVGKFFVEVIAIVNGDGCMHKITSVPVKKEEMELFEQINEKLNGTGSVPSTMAIRQMRDGISKEKWFKNNLFGSYWPSLARICNYKWFEIAEDGIYEVKTT